MSSNSGLTRRRTSTEAPLDAKAKPAPKPVRPKPVRPKPAQKRRVAAGLDDAPPTSAKRKPAVKVIVPIADKLLLTIEEFAAVIGVGRAYACRLIYEGQVHTVTIGRLRRIPRQAAEEYVNSLPAA